MVLLPQACMCPRWPLTQPTSLRVAAGIVPQASLLDLMEAATKPELLLRFNPFLSRDSCDKLHAALLLWLQLCVLEDRCARLLSLVQAGPEYSQQLAQVGVGCCHIAACPSCPVFW
jgi:hypothetical protein